MSAEHKPFVLFVEDDAAVRKHLAAVLADEFDVTGAENGEDALRAVVERRPELVVTDIAMPVMDGVELARTLRQSPRTASIPILMISGRDIDELRDAFDVGADSYLGKPYTERELRRRIRRMLQDAQLRAESVRREERREAERRAFEARATLLESITDAFYAMDRHWRVTYANNRALEYFSMSRDELLGKVLWDVFPQACNTLAYREYERAVREQATISLEIESPLSGRWLEIHAYPHQDGLAVHFRDVTERRQAEQRLRESEARLRLMSDALPALVSYVDQEYRYRLCNHAYESWFGASGEHLLGRTLAEVLGEAAFESVKPFIDRALAGERMTFEQIVPYMRAGTRDVLIDYIPDRTEDGRVHGVYALIQDIRERKAAEMRVKESEARFRSLADNAPVMVWVTEADGSCSYLSKSWYEFTGQSAQEGLGSGWLNAVHPDDALRAADSFAQATATHSGFRLEYRLLRADGTYRWAIDAAQPRFDDHGNFLGFVGSVIDIQERREAEEKMRALNENLEQRVAEALAERKLLADVVDGTDALVQVVDREFRWLAINRASANEFERIFGVRPRVGESMLDTLAHQPEHQSAIKTIWARALAGEEFTQIGEFGDPRRDRRVYEMTYNSLRDRDGRFIGAYQFSYDVTERLRDQKRLLEAQDALRQSQKMETLGQLTGGVAHDFNNLLTPIVGALDMLSRRHSNDVRSQRMTSGALQAADRAKTLIQRLLAFARRQHLEPQAVDVGVLLHGLRDLLSRTLGPRVALSFEVPGRLPAARVDPNQLELALLNLAINSRDAMPDGGTLLISAQEETLSGGHFVRIGVADTGMGMDAETLGRAIEPFFTTKGVGQGTGLGLSMVHGLAAQSGGDFRLESMPGAGTTAWLWLPVATEAVSHEAMDVQPLSDPEALSTTVLLVDDEELVRLGTSSMLADAGYTVVEAASGEEALRLAGEGLKVDVLVTDFAMPGMNGSQLAGELRANHPGLPVLVITGFAFVDVDDSDELPRLAKPFRQAELIASLAEVMGSRQA